MTTIQLSVSPYPEFEELMELFYQGAYDGFCMKCGAQKVDVGAHAYRHTCPYCGADEVHGVENLLLTGAYR